MSHAYRRLACDENSTIIDIGCGTGDALRHLGAFATYLGIDPDQRAIRFARQRWAGRDKARFECRMCTVSDLRTVKPTHVAMIGLLHHLDDSAAVDLLGILRESPRLVRAVTLDIVYVPGRPFNNFMARMDRGRYCRAQDGYAALAIRAGLRVVNRYLARSHPTRGLVQDFVLELAPDEVSRVPEV